MSAPARTLLVVGTGTDVGKTVVTAGLAAAGLAAGLRVAVMKPVQTGASRQDGDLGEIARLAPGIAPLPPELACPYAFPLAASPHLAAEMAGEAIDPGIILAALAAIRARPGIDLVLAEAAGGIMVPLRRNLLQRDVMRQMGAPAILVALAGLGTINHTLLSAEALRAAGIPLAGVVLNRMPAIPGPVETDNRRHLAETLEAPLLAVAPDSPDAAAAVALMRNDARLQAWLGTWSAGAAS